VPHNIIIVVYIYLYMSIMRCMGSSLTALITGTPAGVDVQLTSTNELVGPCVHAGDDRDEVSRGSDMEGLAAHGTELVGRVGHVTQRRLRKVRVNNALDMHVTLHAALLDAYITSAETLKTKFFSIGLYSTVSAA
jgi:hypothetical protein